MGIVVPAFEQGFGQEVSTGSQVAPQQFNTSTDNFGGVEAKRNAERGNALLQVAQTVDDLSLKSDQLAATKALSRAKELANNRLLDNLYSKKPEDLFGQGQTPGEVYKNSTGLFDDVSQVQSMLANNRQRKLFGTAYSEFRAGQSQRISTHLASQFAQHGKLVHDEQIEESDKMIEAAGVETENNPLMHEAQHERVKRDLQSRLALGSITEEDVSDQLHKLDAAINIGRVRGWFRITSNINPAQAAKRLASGKLDEDAVGREGDIQKVWNNLNADQRKKVRADLINIAGTTARLQNDIDESAQDRVEADHKKLTTEIFSLDGSKPEEREKIIALFKKVEQSPYITDTTKNNIRNLISSGGIDRDDEPRKFELKQNIIGGNITTLDEAINFADGLITYETLSGDVVDWLKQTHDESFRHHLQIGRSRLGMPQGTINVDDLIGLRTSQFEGAFRDWYVNTRGEDNDPYDGNINAAMTAIIDSSKDAYPFDAGTARTLRWLAKRGRESASSGDDDAAAKLAAIKRRFNLLLEMAAPKVDRDKVWTEMYSGGKSDTLNSGDTQ
jgi:hypothetical protein